MKITGECVTVGELQEQDIPQVVGVPGIQIRMDGGRIVTLTGLSQDECRAAASAVFMARCTLTVAEEA